MGSGKVLAIGSAGLALAAWLGSALLISSLGCGLFLRAVGPEDPTPRFEAGELRAILPKPLDVVDDACARAIVSLGYESIENDRSPDDATWRAATAGGAPVEIVLVAAGRERTKIRIHVGAYGDETRSRLVLEQIRLAL